MSNLSITENNVKKNKIFYGRFWQYDFTNEHQKFCFINIVDRRSKLIKEKLCYNISKIDRFWAGDLKQDKKYKLIADMIIDDKYEGGFDLQNIRVLSRVLFRKEMYESKNKDKTIGGPHE